MKAEFKTVGFWMTLTTSALGVAAIAFGLTQDQMKAISAVIGAILVAATQFGYLKAEALVRAAKIKALSGMVSNGDMLVASGCEKRVQQIMDI